MGGQSSFDHVQAESESHNPYDRPGFHLEFFLKIQHAHGQKMMDLARWQIRISPRNFLKIQHAHGQKMMDLPRWQTRISPRFFLKMSTWSKDDVPPDDRLGSHLESF